MSQQVCFVCAASLGQPIYRSTGPSLTSLCQIHLTPTTVHACTTCGHLQSAVLQDVDAYYDKDYDILVGSAEEDQVYEIREGVPLYRTQHQVDTFLAKVRVDQPVKLLDYGCAKSSTIRSLHSSAAAIVPHMFDVSERYLTFWQQFVEDSNWAVHSTPARWNAYFDIVTSFFSLEHIPRPAEAIRHIASLLMPGGTFYCVVPNVATNTADFIVVDHCNHFTCPSLSRLLSDAGLEVIQLDEQAHRGAFVLTAIKPKASMHPCPHPAERDVSRTLSNLVRIAEFWRGAGQTVREHEATLPAQERIAIYGAGFYGAFIAANLMNPGRIACHVDQNPFLKGKLFNGRPTLGPDALPAEISTVFVGLNPAHARRIISETADLSSRSLRYFYL